MLGRLPHLHLATLVLVSVALFVGGGLWLGNRAGIALTPPLGAAIGVAAGMVVAWALVHDFRHAARASVVRRR